MNWISDGKPRTHNIFVKIKTKGGDTAQLTDLSKPFFKIKLINIGKVAYTFFVTQKKTHHRFNKLGS